jgi:secreted trypsin-like serine protease
MKYFIVLLLAAYCNARPGEFLARPALMGLGAESFIVGGTEAGVGEFPWQLSQQRLGAAWSHSCGSSLLGLRRTLTAAHCVDGASVNILRVIAGLHDRTASNGVVANVARYQMHPNYNDGQQTFNNDIGVIHTSSDITQQGWIRYATLPRDNSNSHAGETCVISGWGRTSSSNVLPNNLQKASIQVITEGECNQRMAPVSGARVGPGQICLYTPSIGSCNGDSGGPLNCGTNEGGNDERIVSGVTSWGIQSGGACLQTYPSVYTRTSHHLNWINEN